MTRPKPYYLILTTEHLKLSSHLLLFSLSIIFFQYVKELFYLTPLANAVFTAQKPAFQGKRGE